MRSGARFIDGDVFANFLKYRSQKRSCFRTEHAPTLKHNEDRERHASGVWSFAGCSCIPVWAAKSQRRRFGTCPSKYYDDED